LAETAKQNDRDCRLCPPTMKGNTTIQVYMCVAWQCTSFWQLCLHWSWHSQSRKFRNTYVQCNINLECSNTFIVLYQGSPNSFVRGSHIVYYTTIRGPDILRILIVLGYVTFYEINQFFVYILFRHYCQNSFTSWTNWFHRP